VLTFYSLNARKFEEAGAIARGHEGQSRLARFFHAPDSQTKLMDAMSKLNRVISLLQVLRICFMFSSCRRLLTMLVAGSHRSDKFLVKRNAATF